MQYQRLRPTLSSGPTGPTGPSLGRTLSRGPVSQRTGTSGLSQISSSGIRRQMEDTGIIRMRTRTRVACNRCRDLRKKCNGQNPFRDCKRMDLKYKNTITSTTNATERDIEYRGPYFFYPEVTVTRAPAGMNATHSSLVKSARGVEPKANGKGLCLIQILELCWSRSLPSLLRRC